MPKATDRKQSKSTTTLTAPIPPRMLNAAAAAAYLGIGTFALRGLHWRESLRGIFIGRKLLFDVRDLDAFIERSKAQAA